MDAEGTRLEKSVDMTTGDPGKLIITFAVPMILGNVVQQLYSMVDSVVVGRFVGKAALAGIGATMSVLNMIICVIIGLTMGTCVITAQYFGAGEKEKVRETAGTAVYISFGMWIVIGLLGITMAGPLLRALDTPEEIQAGAQLYLTINTCTSIAPIAYNMTANIMRSLGDSKGPLYALITSSVMNIVLDLLFVLVFHWDIAGVAWATVISQTASALVNLYRIRRHHEILRLTAEHLRLRAGIVKRVISVGVPMSIQNAVSSVGLLGIQRMINGYGMDTVAAFTAAGKIDQIALMPVNSLGMAVSTYAGQNFGKRDVGRIRAGLKAGVLQAVSLGVCMMAVVLLFVRPLTGLFVSPKETEVIAITEEFFRTTSVFYWLCGSMYVFLNLFRGMGMMKISMIASCLDPVVRLSSAYVLGHAFGRAGLWLGWPAGWAVALIIPLVCYFRRSWQSAVVTAA